MVRKAVFFIVIFITSLTLSAMEWGNGLNVKDFGAKGDGVTDDTAAIQKALNFCRQLHERQLLAKQPLADDLPEFANHKILSVTGENILQPEIFFPAGRYLVSSTLVAGEMFIRGEEGSVIVMTDPAQDVLYCNRGYRSRVENMTFEGGKRQLLYYTFNEDMTNIIIENCTFRNASGYAVWSHNYRNPAGRDYRTATLGPYVVTWDGDTPILTPGDETLSYYYNSTLLTVYNCVFENCPAIDAITDGFEVSNCRFFAPENFTGAVIKTGGACRFTDCYGFAPAGGTDKYWFSFTGGTPFVNGCVFECGDAEGMSLALWKSSRRGEIYDLCGFTDNAVACGSNPLLFIDNSETENTPNIIEISNCTEITGSGAQLIQWAVPFDFERAKTTFFDFSWAIENLDGSYSAEFPFLLCANCNAGFDDSDIPAEMWQNASQPLPQEVFAAAEVPALDLAWNESDIAAEFKAADFGVDLDSKTDDTAAMKKLFAAAAEVDGKVKIIMPPALVTLSETITVPANFIITSPGLGSIKGLDITKPLFKGSNVEYFAIRNMRLLSGLNAFALDCTADAEILIEKCLIYQQYDSSFLLDAPAGNNACLKIDRCMFISPIQGLTTNFAHNDFANSWISTNGRQDNEAFIENMGGAMRLHGMLGVPMTTKDHGYNHLPFVENWPFSNNTRWVDNYGKFYSVYSRYGGEYYGFTPVHNFTAEGSVYIEGSYFCAAFPDCTNCIVYCEETPSLMVFRDFGWHWKRGVQQAVKYASPDLPMADVWCCNFYYNKDSFNAK